MPSYIWGEGISRQGRWTAARKEVLWKSRIDSTALLVNALQRCAAPPKIFVCASAIGIWQPRRRGAFRRKRTRPRFLSRSGASLSRRLRPRPCRWSTPALASHRVALEGALLKMHLPFKLGLGGRLGSGRQFMSWISSQGCRGGNLLDGECSRPERTGQRGRAPRLSATASSRGRWGGRCRPTLFPAPVFALRIALGEMADEALLSSQRVEPAKLLAADFTFSPRRRQRPCLRSWDRRFCGRSTSLISPE